MIEVTDCEVVEADIDPQGLAMLIGRDVLSHSAFTYDGTTGTWTLEIPRTQPPGQAAAFGSPQFGSLEKAKTARKASKKSRKKNRGK